MDIVCDSKCSTASGKHFPPLNKQSARQFQALSLPVSLWQVLARSLRCDLAKRSPGLKEGRWPSMGGDTPPVSVACGQPEGCSSKGDGDVLHQAPGTNTCPAAEPQQGGDEARRGAGQPHRAAAPHLRAAVAGAEVSLRPSSGNSLIRDPVLPAVFPCPSPADSRLPRASLGSCLCLPRTWHGTALLPCPWGTSQLCPQQHCPRAAGGAGILQGDTGCHAQQASSSARGR